MRNNLIKIILLTLFFSSAASAKIYYSAIVDAGSSGSRIYLYQYEKSVANDINQLQLIASKKVSPGISAYAAHPAEITSYILPLLQFAQQHFNPLVKEDQVTFSLMATAGMRLVSPEQQEQIYNNIKAALQKYTYFQIKTIETIPGQWEAIYGWVAANYANHSLQPNKTIGILDMGGASTEVAFATSKSEDTENIAKIQLGKNDFSVYAVSYLGLGQNQARSQFMNNKNCFPKNYLLPDKTYAVGNYEECVKSLNPVLKDIQDVQKIKHIMQKNTQFVAVSWFHDLLHSSIFTSSKGFTLRQLHHKGESFCALDWNDAQVKYANDPALYSTCFNLAYYYALLKHAYDFKKDYYFNTKKDVDWALGVVVYEAYNS